MYCLDRSLSGQQAVSAAMFLLGAIGAVAALKWSTNCSTRTTSSTRAHHDNQQFIEHDGGERKMHYAEPSNGIPLPTHLQREIYKEERREKMIPKLTRAKPMYDNVIMKDPRGTILSTVSIKKAKWYVRKNLAVWKSGGDDSGDEKAIQLLFQPETTTAPSSSSTNHTTAGSTISLREYNSSIKQNRCVGCGAERDYMKHYIVPYSYRTLFPDHFKTHLPHDIVILCASRCHLRAQQAVHYRMNTLEHRERQRRQNMDLHPTSGQAELVDLYKYRVRSAATALLQWKAKLPENKIAAYERLVCEWARNNKSECPGDDDNENTIDAADAGNSSLTPTLEQLETASLLQCRSPNPHFVSGAELIVDFLRSDSSKKKKNDDDDATFDEGALSDFVRGWRQHFLDVVRPRYLPKGWSVDAPVQSDRRKGV